MNQKANYFKICGLYGKVIVRRMGILWSLARQME